MFLFVFLVGQGLCCNGQCLLMVGVQFPHIILLPQIGNRKPFAYIKIDKKLKLVVPNFVLKILLSQIRIDKMISEIIENHTSPCHVIGQFDIYRSLCQLE